MGSAGQSLDEEPTRSPADERPGAPATAVLDGRAGSLGHSVLAPSLTPRPAFQVTRRLVGVSKYPLGLLTAIYAINQSHQFLLPVLFPFIKQEFRLSDTALGLLGGSYLLMLTVGTVPFGILADRVRRTKVIAWGTSAWGVAMIYAGLAGSYVHLFVARTLLGVADPADNPTSQSLLADYYPVNQRARVMGIYEGGRLLGILALPIAGGMAEAWGWRATFFFFAMPGFVVAAMAWRLHEPERGIQDRRHQNLDGGIEESGYLRMSSWRAYAQVLRIPTFSVQLVSSGLANLFLGGVGVWAVTFMIRYHDVSVSGASVAIGLFAVGALVGSLSAGYVADFLTFRGLRASRVYVAAGGRIMATLLFIPAFVTGNLAMMLVLFTVGAAVLVAPAPALNAVRADVLHPHLRGRGNALDAVTQSLAAAVSPIVFGVLSDMVTLRSAFLVMTPVVGLAGLVLLLLGPPLYARDERRVLRAVSGDDDVDETVQTVSAPRETAAARAAAPDARSGGDGAGEDLLVLRDVDCSYGPLQVLFDVSLVVPRGRCVAILGPNGAGKTTLLKVVSGHVDPRAGSVVFDGRDIGGVPPDQRARLGITLMGGGRSTFPSLSVYENLWLGAFPYATDAARLVDERVDAVLDVFSALRPRLRQAAGTLSGGEQQMIALGRALVAGSELLLIDELSMGLAPIVTEELAQVVPDILDLGTTILVVEQSVPVALDIADEVYGMEKGSLRRLGTARSLRRKGGDRLARSLMTGEEEPSRRRRPPRSGGAGRTGRSSGSGRRRRRPLQAPASPRSGSRRGRKRSGGRGAGGS